jgi:hypothetical protein
VLVIAIVAAVVLSAVFLGGLIGGASSGTSPLTTGPAFSSARNVADQFAAAHGSWSLFEALGIALFNASFFSYNGSTGNASCIPVTLTGTVPANITLPAFRGDLESGQAPVWVFGYLEPGVGAELAVFEVGSQILLAIEVPGSCDLSLAQYPGITTPIIDSPAAVAAAAAAGGASFLRAHSAGVSLEMVLIGGIGFTNSSVFAPMWDVTWTTCSNVAFGSGLMTSGYEFSAGVNATTGTLVPSSIENTTCGSSIPPPTSGIGGAISLGIPNLEIGPGSGGTIASQGCNSGDYCYTLPIDAASENITPADFEMSVQNFSNGTPIMTAAGFAIVNAAGTVLVYSVGAVETQWTPAAGNSQTLLTAGMVIDVDLGLSYSPSDNWGVVLTGEGPFANSSLGMGL